MQRTFMELQQVQPAPLQETIVMMSCFDEHTSSRRRPEKCFLVLPKLSATHYKMFPQITPKLLLLHLRLVVQRLLVIHKMFPQIIPKLLPMLNLGVLVLCLLVRPCLLLNLHLIIVRIDGEPAKMLVMFLLREHARHEGEAGVEVELSQ